MKTKHSPAPWYAVNYGGYIHLQPEDHYSSNNLLDEDKCDKAIANGQLASCAPDLLEALQELMSCYDRDGHLLNFNVSTARKVIIKATTI